MSANARTINYFLQLKHSVIFKAVAVLSSLMLVPTAVNYLGADRFGVWVTLYSIISWMIFFDLGLGSGLRNGVAKAFAENDYGLVNELVSTAYVLMTALVFLVFIIFLVAYPFLDWQRIFNAGSVKSAEIGFSAIIFLFFFSINFIFSLVNQLMHASQRSSRVVMLQMFASLLSLVAVFLCSYIFDASLIVVSIAVGVGMLLPTLFFNAWYFSANPSMVPRLSAFKLSRIHDIGGIGVRFFTIQISVLVIFSTDRIVIAQLFGAAEVAQYELAFRLIGAVTILHSLMTTPMWSAYTNAYHSGDIEWVKRSVKKQIMVLIPIAGIIGLLVVLGDWLIGLWVGGVAHVDGSVLFFLGIMVFINCWNDVFGSLLAGIGKVRLGSIYTIFMAIMNIPLSVFFAREMGMGVSGVVLGTIASIMLSAVVSPLQVYYFIFSQAKSPVLTRILQ